MIVPAVLGLLLVVQPSPEQFFVGRTESTGSATILMRGTHAVRDSGRGRIERGNVLILDQTVHETGKPARRRTWRLVRTPDNRIAGTISDIFAVSETASFLTMASASAGVCAGSSFIVSRPSTDIAVRSVYIGTASFGTVLRKSINPGGSSRAARNSSSNAVRSCRFGKRPCQRRYVDSSNEIFSAMSRIS